jgi:DNA-binding HxlR family transcriptional regulator
MRNGATPACPTLNLMHILGKKWTVPLMEELYFSKGVVSFNSLQDVMVGITAKNLSDALKELESESLVSRSESKVGGVLHTSYKLSARGKEVASLIRQAKRLGIHLYGVNQHCDETSCKDCVLFAPMPRPTARSVSSPAQVSRYEMK